MYHGKVVAPHGTTATSAMKTTDPVAEFKRGIKRGYYLYPTLKAQKHWNNWN